MHGCHGAGRAGVSPGPYPLRGYNPVPCHPCPGSPTQRGEGRLRSPPLPPSRGAPAQDIRARAELGRAMYAPAWRCATLQGQCRLALCNATALRCIVRLREGIALQSLALALLSCSMRSAAMARRGDPVQPDAMASPVSAQLRNGNSPRRVSLRRLGNARLRNGDATS